MSKKRLGLIINPIAGIGGRVGLHGSDGVEIQKRALALGAQPEANRRTTQAITRLDALKEDIDIVTCPAEMGESAVKAVGWSPGIVGSSRPGATTGQDTRDAASEMARKGVDLLMFAGGDGTARDICAVVGDKLTVLGIPAGVKIHSAVYAVNARAAGDLAVSYLRGDVNRTREAEVMDIEEESFRLGVISTRLYGFLTIPAEPRMTQATKAPSPTSENEALAGIASRIVQEMEQDVLYIFGPGTTTRAIVSILGLSKTLIGVDVIRNAKLIAADANEQQIIRLLEESRGKIIITPIGGQGCLFGRGNQQLSPRVIEMVGKENILVASTREKLNGLGGRPFWVDTGDQKVDQMLAGYIGVITGYREKAIYQVMSAQA